MKGLIITHPGCEKVASLEVKELIGQKAETHESCVSFNIKSYQELCKLCYLSQSAIKVLLLLNQGKVQNKEDTVKLVNALDLSEWVNKKTSIAARCKATKFQSIDVEKIAGEALVKTIKEKQGFKPEVDLEDPDITIFVYIFNQDCYIGVDFTGFDLSKRSYKIFSHANAIKGTIGYSLFREAECKDSDTILDPFSGSATIPIEAALYATKTSANFFAKKNFVFTRFLPLKDTDFAKFFAELDKKRTEPKTKILAYDFLTRYVDAGKKNAKIAGVEKNINFARVDLEWLDLKFDKESVDRIIANPPRFSVENEKKIKKLYNELFYQASLILKPTGSVTLVTTTPDKVKEQATKNSFSAAKELEAYQGKEKIYFLIFKKAL